MNVTKKWTELKEAWMKEKENLNQNQGQNCSTCTLLLMLRFRGALTLRSMINDRLQDKINILKSQAQMQEPIRPPLQPTNSKEQMNRSKDQNMSKDSSLHSFLRKSKET